MLKSMKDGTAKSGKVLNSQLTIHIDLLANRLDLAESARLSLSELRSFPTTMLLSTVQPFLSLASKKLFSPK